MSKHKFFRKAELLKLANSLPGAVYQYREWPTGRCTFPYSTRNIENIFFATPKELSKDGKIGWSRICPETAAELREKLKQSAETLESFEIVFRTLSPQNRLHWIRNHAVPERLRDGSTLWHGHMENITAQHEADEAAKQQASLLSVIFKNLPDHIYYKDCDGRILGANPACCQHHGRTLDEMIGKTDIELSDSDLAKELYAQEQTLIANGKIVRKQEKHVRNDGNIIYLESVKCPLHSKSGRIIGLAGISRDITQQVENEQALVKAKQQAEESAALINAIFENLPDHLYYKDRQSRLLGANNAFMKARHTERIEDLIGKTDIELHPAPLGQQLYENEQRQIKTGETTRVRERHKRSDGQIQYLESIKSPFKNKNGEIIGLVGISRDVTRQVENEKNLISAQQDAEAANRAKSSFLAMMSHEIRTPMNGVIGASSLLLGTELDQQQEELVHTIQVSGENLMTILNDILDYSKIEAGKIELEAVPFSLRECLEDAFDLFVQPAAKKNLELLYYVEPDVPEALLGDPTRLRQILVNLLGNAIKFTEEGEVSIHVNILTRDETNDRCRLEFSVRDTGIGISEEAQKRLFQSFIQADTSSTRKYGGTGLGLAISRRLTELMNGKIWIESKKGEGSTFYFTAELPIAAALNKQAGALPEEALHGKRVLIVDDNQTNRNILCAQMEQWGAVPMPFSHPEQVIDHLRQNPPYDIALLDYQMPGTNGVTLAKAIHKLPDYPYMPTIMLSSSCETIPPHPAISVRMAKPIKVGKLRHQMLQLLSGDSLVAESTAHPDARVRPKKSSDLRILIAEDNPVNRRVAQMMIQRLGYNHAVFVEDGLEAVAAVIDADYDVILMDVQMPHMNGLDAAREIRKHTGSKTNPWIIALTAGVMEEERKNITDAGMNEFLAKPLGVDQLEEKLDAAGEMINNR
ncbi:MAG: response regulator [Verrucomicrobia bacterium]|nr:response regulator [Verrucomicrobiota bacterium]